MKFPVKAAAAAGLIATSSIGLAVGMIRTQRVPRENPPSGHFVGEAGRRLHYVQVGEGPDLVLIHGASMNLQEMLAGPVDLLARTHRVTLFDRPGHGHSDADLEHASPQEQAARIHAAVSELGLERPIVVGHSLGGTVALAYGAAYPEETGGLVLLAPLSHAVWGVGHIGPALHAAPGLGAGLSWGPFALFDPAVMRFATSAIFAPQRPTPRFNRCVARGMLSLPSAMRADGADFMLATMALQTLRRGYAEFQVPVHVIVGAADRVLKPDWHGRRLAREMPSARLTELPGLGHMLHHFDPKAVLAAVEEVRARIPHSAQPADAGWT
ncbi:MAG: alpha/beta hydrolase [Hyphomonadaceae bacterium]|nr:alpha/beta hydrolase [Hyphomonadaceae bacterium]